MNHRITDKELERLGDIIDRLAMKRPIFTQKLLEEADGIRGNIRSTTVAAWAFPEPGALADVDPSHVIEGVHATWAFAASDAVVNISVLNVSGEVATMVAVVTGPYPGAGTYQFQLVAPKEEQT